MVEIFFHPPRFVPPRKECAVMKTKSEIRQKIVAQPSALHTEYYTKYRQYYYYYKRTMTVYATYLQVAAIQQYYTRLLYYNIMFYCVLTHARYKSTFPITHRIVV
uniref:Uncharacterized protein n=1 Tax=Schizaphis graminum TaxID=13262 RepID=A0A2S2NP29_SCHGA